MLCPFQIRRRSQAMRDQQAEDDSERYRYLYEELKAADRAEYEREFGATYRARHPFKPNGQSLHARVTAMMQAERDD